MHHVMQYLEQSAHRFPKHVAVIDEHGSCTFSELRKRSLDVAAVFLNKGIARQPIIVLMEKCREALYAFFGISYTLNFYTLLNPELPEQRLRQIQEVLQARYVVTDLQHYELAKRLFTNCEILLIEKTPEASKEDTQHVLEKMERHVDIDPLYIHFTSGSTGVPKGVVVSHQSVIEFIDIFTQTFRLGPNDRIGNQAPFDFDVSVKDIYSCLKVGATLVIIPRRHFSNPTALMDYLCDQGITTLIWAVSALSLICIFHGLRYRIPKTITKVMFSGEVMPLKHLKQWQDALPEAMFVNLYGPTEVTCNCTYHIVDPLRDYEKGIPIGHPFMNEAVFLLADDGTQITTAYQTGEIVVRGRCLALGYYHQTEETAKHFIQNPLCSQYPERVYLTGDLGYYNEQGELVYAGRKDFQIKYLGHRIELEEIERQVLTIHEVTACCCLFEPHKKKLYGFYVGTLSPANLVRTLRTYLPAYMIPGQMIKLENLPLSKNGKTDRQALKRRLTGESETV